MTDIAVNMTLLRPQEKQEFKS